MKYILSRKLKIFVASHYFQVILPSGICWTTNRTVIQFLTGFFEPQKVDSLCTQYGSNKRAVLDLVEQLKAQCVLVPENHDHYTQIDKDKLILIKENTSFLIYSDVKGNDDDFIFFEKNILELIKLFDKKLHVKPDKFFICIFFNIENFRQLGNGLPDWAKGFVVQDHLILFVQNIEAQSNNQEYLSHYLRSLSHELGHIVTYQNCRFVPNWFSEGVSEYIACHLFPHIQYDFFDLRSPTVYLKYFFNRPDESLIDFDSNKAVNNRLYCEAGQYIKHLLRGGRIQELFKELQGYRLQQPIEKYFLHESCLA